MDTVKQIRARFESASSLDQMSESPRLKKTNSGTSLKAMQHVNGTNEPSSPSLPTSPPPRVPPPVPPKRKISKETIAIHVTEENDTGKQLQDQEILDALRKEKCDLEKEIALLKKESREDKKKLKRYEHKLDHFEASCKARRAQGPLKRWVSSQPSISDLYQPMTHDELGDAQELIQQFVESERLYLNALEIINHNFYQPMTMMAVFKRDILSFQQLQTIFLNSSQLLVLHRLFYDHLFHLRYLPKQSRVEEFLAILERTAPSLSLYSGFQSEYFMQTLQKELSQSQSKQQISMLLEHLERECDGKSLADMLRIPAGRLSEYVSLLSPFLEERVRGTRGINDGVIKRIETLIHYINSLQVELLDEKSEWECIVEKLKILNKFSPDGPIPLEVFCPETRLVKQGPVMITEKGKEVQKFCFLFTTHIALADRGQNHHFVVTENAIIPLAGATLYENVDMAGQIIEADLHSGLEQDMLGFRINFCKGNHFFLRVGRPNEKKQWIENIEKTLEKIQKSEADMNNDSVIPDIAPKIAAASLEKLFQHLTNPQIGYREDFIEVFLQTYPCFTTPKDVLTALLNCIRSPKEKTPDPTSSVQTTPNHVFTFNMDDSADTESCNTSITSMSASNSMHNFSSGSDTDSIDGSPTTPRRKITPEDNNPVDIAPNSGKPPLPVVSRTSMSTDSDSSPCTADVPVDSKKKAQNGWQDTEGTSKIRHTSSVTTRSDGTLLSTEAAYVTFCRPYSRESGSLGDSEGEETDFNGDTRPSLGFNVMENSLVVGPVKNLSISADNLADTDSVVDKTLGFRKDMHSQDLDKIILTTPCPKTSFGSLPASQLLEDAENIQHNMLHQFDRKEAHSQDDIDDCFDPMEDEINFRKYTGGSRARRSSEAHSSGRQIHPDRFSTSSALSLSEPDLVIAAVKHEQSRSDDRSMLEDKLLNSLPANVARKFMEPSTPSKNRLSSPSPSHGRRGRFSLGFNKSKRTRDTLEKPRKSDPSVVLSGTSMNNSSSLYFASPEPQKKSNTSPSRGFGGLFKKGKPKEERGRLNKSLSSNFTDGMYPETPTKKGAKLNRNASLGPVRNINPYYMNIDDFSSIPKSPRERVEDSSPRVKRKLGQPSRNFSLASKIFAVLMKWIEICFEDFEDDVQLMYLLEEFLHEMTDTDTPESKLAQQTYREFLYYRDQCHPTNPSFGNLLCRITNIDLCVLEDIDFDKPAKLIGGREIDLSRTSREPSFVRSVAQQITLMEFACYNAVKRSELLNCNWKKKDKEVLAPNVCRMIQRTNEMTSWICTEVLSRETVAARAVVLENFIQIGWTCYKHNDMHCAMNIALALSSTSVKRLSKTWDTVEKKIRQKYEKLKDATDHHEKCKKLRERLEHVTTEGYEKTGCIPSCLPYLGAHLEQIYVLDIGLKTYNSDGLVNFAKMTKLSSLINGVLQYQTVPYNFEPKLDIIAYITSAKRLSDNELYDLSVSREPSKR